MLIAEHQWPGAACAPADSCVQARRWLAGAAGVDHADGQAVADQLADKVAQLRCFEDDQDKRNLSILDVGGPVPLVGQFTLYADLSRGVARASPMPRRPKGTNALVDYFGEALRRSLHVERGRFGAYMHVSLASEGPFPIWLGV